MIRLSLLSLLILCSCHGKSSFAEKAVVSYRSPTTSASINEETLPIQHYAKNKEAVWQFLDRATVRLAQGDAAGSVVDYLTAIDAAEYYRNQLVQEQATQLLIDDAQAPYIPPSYETLLSRFMAACACFQADDPKNGIALLRQALERESLERELGALTSNDFHPLIHYLLAMAMEVEGDFSQANLLYDRLGIKNRPASKGKGHLVFVIYDGVLPEKMSEIAPVSVVSMQLLEVLLSAWDIQPALSSLSGVAIPVFPENVSRIPSPPLLSVNGERIPLSLSYDLFAAAKTDLERQIPSIATRAAARQLIRRASVGYAYEKDQTIGSFVDIGMLVANLITTADTRMWNTLPKEVRIFRTDLEPGIHTISAASDREHRIRVNAGELVVVQLFRPYGHETHLLIPKSKETS